MHEITFHRIIIGPEWNLLKPGDSLQVISLKAGERIVIPPEIHPMEDGSLLVGMVTEESDSDENVKLELTYIEDDGIRIHQGKDVP